MVAGVDVSIAELTDGRRKRKKAIVIRLSFCKFMECHFIVTIGNFLIGIETS
jgi:hypothetical protein